MKEIIQIKKITKKNILQEITITINEGDCIGIMGNSGAGKSTLLNIISGLEKPTTGSVVINKVNITNLKEPKLTKFRATNISYIFQDYKLVDYLTVEENIKLIEKNNKAKINLNKYDTIVNSLGLQDKLKMNVKKLSGGQKQRVAIARSLIGRSKIIFADEPTGALDLVNKKIVLNELITNSKLNNKTLIIVTHDPDVALTTDQILFISNGKLDEIIKTKDIDIAKIEARLFNNYEK
ncbi:ABC transporter ATP-binding protein [Mesoplasma syrphidae]|uniref:ABC transporter ATP-binding protein n=1 Tax=Mesoplasma syrphidae TaxID=225999 RepID=A0A2K9CCP9_9MOLU|nr:ABC transporter ATP-binding protein [Mesoplasma syrphidae]AUF83424.1 ABC transporter ATP-binding protein [Mesoplasma syrphidae]